MTIYIPTTLRPLLPTHWEDYTLKTSRPCAAYLYACKYTHPNGSTVRVLQYMAGKEVLVGVYLSGTWYVDQPVGEPTMTRRLNAWAKGYGNIVRCR